MASETPITRESISYKIIRDRVTDLDRRDYLFRILDNFERFFLENDPFLQDVQNSDILSLAAADLVLGTAFLSNRIISPFNFTKSSEFYANNLIAWIWAVDHSSKGDSNKKIAQEIVGETLKRVDDGQIIGASDGQIHLLEVGCAHGRDFHFLARKSQRMQYLGIDFSPAMIDIAKKLNPDGNFQVGNILNLRETVTQKQATVFAAAVLHHFDDDEKVRAIDQIRSVLADNGLLYLSLRYGDCPQHDVETGLIYHATTDQGLNELVTQRGFMIEKMYHTNSPRGIEYINALMSAKPKV